MNQSNDRWGFEIMTNLIHVLLVDDHSIVREGLKKLLKMDPRFVVAGEVCRGYHAVEACMNTTIDVVLLDMRLAHETGDQICRKLKALPNPPRVLILTSYGDDNLVVDALSAGADGYLLKDVDGADLIAGIHSVAQGKAVLDPNVTRVVIDRARKPHTSFCSNPLEQLPARELLLVRHIAEGLTNHEIACRMNITEGTVRNYLTGVFLKLGVKRRAQAAAIYQLHSAQKT